MKRALIIGLVSAGCLALGWCFAAYMRAIAFRHTIVVVENDPILASTVQKHFETLCRNTFDAHNPSAWTQTVLNKHQLIETIRCSKQDYGAVLITITAKPLRFTVNGVVAIDTQGHNHAADLIDDDYLKQLPTIITQHPINLHESAFTTFARSVPEWLIHQYAIAWQSPYNLWLHDHQTNALIRIRANQIPNEALLRTAQHLLSHTTSKRKIMYADIRFTNQIVIAHYKGDLGGEGDVKSFFRANSRID